MNNKELLNNLKKLSGVAPSKNWQEKNRDLLLSQIDIGADGSQVWRHLDWSKFVFRLPAQIARNITQPVVFVFVILLFLVGTGFISAKASKNSKPGDSLYIAKIASEKTQYAFTFDNEKKVRLGLEFANNRADEINQVLAESNAEDVEASSRARKEKVEKLVNNYKKEIDGAQSRLSKISQGTSIKNESDAAAPINQTEGAAEADENNQVFSADLGKDDKGLEISDHAVAKGPRQEEKTDDDISDDISKEDIPASPVEEIGPNASSTAVIGEQINDSQIMLEQAEELLDQENYNATLDKLDEVKEIIDQVDMGQVKGEEASATSSQDDLSAAGENSGVEAAQLINSPSSSDATLK